MLNEALQIADAVDEPPLVKAVRKGYNDIANLILGLNRSKYLEYEQVLCLADNSGKNVLHHAVSKQATDIVRKLIYFDSDHGKLRSMKDTKNKVPLQADAQNLFKDMF